MKKYILLLIAFACLGTGILFAQKKENGAIYIDHPAIKVIAEFEKAAVAGDSAKIAGFLTDDFKAYSGTTTNFNDSIRKAEYVGLTLRYSREFDYFAIDPIPGSYPDALDYKKDNKDGDVVVQDWIILKGMHKVTGVKLDAAAQRIYYVTKEYKIKRLISYANGRVMDEVFASFSNRTNGKIFNHHDNINTVRKSMYTFEKGDVDKSLSAYSDEARFYDINFEWNKTISKAEEKTFLQKFLADYEIKGIDMIGYPDYLEYEMNDGREVLSWWKYNLVRKKDKKVIVLPIHLSDSFDDKGKIINEVVYYSESLLTK